MVIIIIDKSGCSNQCLFECSEFEAHIRGEKADRIEWDSVKEIETNHITDILIDQLKNKEDVDKYDPKLDQFISITNKNKPN